MPACSGTPGLPNERGHDPIMSRRAGPDDGGSNFRRSSVSRIGRWGAPRDSGWDGPAVPWLLDRPVKHACQQVHDQSGKNETACNRQEVGSCFG